MKRSETNPPIIRRETPVQHWLGEHVEISRQKVMGLVATWITICAIAGWIAWKIWP